MKLIDRGGKQKPSYPRRKREDRTSETQCEKYKEISEHIKKINISKTYL
jgi:hypothetical protein